MPERHAKREVCNASKEPSSNHPAPPSPAQTSFPIFNPPTHQAAALTISINTPTCVSTSSLTSSALFVHICPPESVRESGIEGAYTIAKPDGRRREPKTGTPARGWRSPQPRARRRRRSEGWRVRCLGVSVRLR